MTDVVQVVYRKEVGEPIAPTLLPLFLEGYREYLCLDQEVMEETAWLTSTLALLHGMPRYELEFWNGDSLVGGAMIAVTIDFHVGPCVSVLTQYARPNFRGSAGMGTRVIKYAKRLARENGVRFICFSQQQEPGVQLLRYRRI